MNVYKGCTARNGVERIPQWRTLWQRIYIPFPYGSIVAWLCRSGPHTVYARYSVQERNGDEPSDLAIPTSVGSDYCPRPSQPKSFASK